MQDVRGRYESEGEWYPFKYEGNDGYDTIEWAGSLPYSNGKVGMFGGSYGRRDTNVSSSDEAAHLAAICPTVTASNYHENWNVSGRRVRTVVQPIVDFRTGGKYGNAAVERIEDRDRWHEDSAADGISGDEGGCEWAAPYYLDWLAHPNFDEYWKQWSIEDHYGQIQVPVFTVAAWYDNFHGRVRCGISFRLQTEAGSEAARKGQSCSWKSADMRAVEEKSAQWILAKKALRMQTS